ncbi:NACHT domain-containing protein [Nocardia sp. NPDC055053]
MTDRDAGRSKAMVHELAALYLYRVRVEAGLRAGSYRDSEPVKLGDRKYSHAKYHVDLYYIARLVERLCPELLALDPVVALENLFGHAMQDKRFDRSIDQQSKITKRGLLRTMYILGDMEREADEGKFASELMKQIFASEPDRASKIWAGRRRRWIDDARERLVDALLKLEEEFEAKSAPQEPALDSTQSVDQFAGNRSTEFVLDAARMASSQTETSEEDAGTKSTGAPAVSSAFVGSPLVHIDTVNVNPPQSRRLLDPTNAQFEAAKMLTQTVLKRCKEERRALRLESTHPMPVRWSLTKQQRADRRVNAFGGSGPFAFDATSKDHLDAAAQFRKLARSRLVILGESGAGKTVFAETLQWGLLEQKEWEIVPIFLRANSWNVAEQKSLRDWIVHRLTIDYPEVWGRSQKTLPGELYDAHLILPVIDGLDEVVSGIRSDIVKALNQHLTQHDGLVVSCRTETYREIVEESGIIARAAVIEAHPLKGEEAAKYLVDLAPEGDPTWLEMKNALVSERSQPLSKVCSSPLGLWLVRTIYIDKDYQRDQGAVATTPLELLDTDRFGDPETIQNYLFDCLVPAVLDRRTVSEEDKADLRRPRTKWRIRESEQWLSHVARTVDPGGTIEWWHLSGKPQVKWRTVNQLIDWLFEGRQSRITFSIIALVVALGFLAYEEVWYLHILVSAVMLLSPFAAVPIVLVWRIRRIEEPPMPTGSKSLKDFVGYEIRHEAKGFLWAPLVGGAFLGFFAWYGNLPFSKMDMLCGWMVDMLPAGLSMSAVAAIWAVIGVLVAPVLVFLASVQHGISRWLRPKEHDSGCPKHSPRLKHDAYQREQWDSVEQCCITCGWSCNCPNCESIRGAWRNPESTYRVSRIRALAGIPVNILYMVVVVGFIIWFYSMPDGSTPSDSSHWVAMAPLMLIIAIPFAIPIGVALTIAREPSWYSYFFVSRWSARRGKLPKKTIDFLEDMHRVGLFRIDGAAYRFRHIELQRHMLNKMSDGG